MNTQLTDSDSAAIDSLVEQTRAGDERAFAHLVRRMQPRVHRWVLAYVLSADEADDIVQDVFVHTLSRLHQYRNAGTFSVWMYRMTRRMTMRNRTKLRRRALLAAGPRAAPDRVVYETDPGSRVDRERLAAVVREFWLELPERQRAVLDLVDLQGYSPGEAAEMLELNPSTLRANLFKARASMRTRLIAQFPSWAAAGGDRP